MSSGDAPNRDRILILDFGSQYTQLIARRIREHHVYCEIHPHSMELESIEECGPAGIVLSGGPSSGGGGSCSASATRATPSPIPFLALSLLVVLLLFSPLIRNRSDNSSS